MRELQSGQGPRRASEPYLAGSFGEGAAPRRHLRYEAGNAFLPEFMEQFNEKFSVPAAKAENLHRRLNVQASRLADILCHREQRHVSQQLSLAYDRRQIILERSELADKLAGQYVEVYDFAIGRSRCDGKVTRFPIASSAKTSVSATQPSSRTSAWATLSLP